MKPKPIPLRDQPKATPKKYSFSKPEFLYVSEQRSIMELHDSLIRRYVAAVVLDRLGINSKDKYIRVDDKGEGIEVYDVPQAQEQAPVEDTKKPASKK